MANPLPLPADISLRHAEGREDISASHAVMLQLRPKLVDHDTYCAQIARQQSAGYNLLAAWRGNAVVGLAGYRELENTIYGRFVYVDDLVVSEAGRDSQLGKALLDAVAAETNPLAQRFYFRWGMLAKGLHFVWPITD
jgi:ribosomal protein S18 acetylase RimI-like enzyme